MAAKTKGSYLKVVGDNKALKQRIKQLEADHNRPRMATNRRVYADKPRSELADQDKFNLMLECNQDIRKMFEYVNRDKRKRKKEVFNAHMNLIRDVLERWTIDRTGNRWLVNSLAFRECIKTDGSHKVVVPEEDFVDIDFVHKVYLRYMINDHGQNIIDLDTPPTMDIFQTVRVYRYELEDVGEF